MGCGKSKLDAIASGNVLSRKKSSVNGVNTEEKEVHADQESIVKEETTVPANGVDKEEKEVHQKASIDNVEQLIVEGDKVAMEEEEEKELVVVEGDRLVSKESPEKYFSSRHQRVESLDDKSEYLSPRIDDSSKESPFNGDVVDDHPVDGTITAEASKTETEATMTMVEEKEEKPSTMDEPVVVPVGGKEQDAATNQV